MVSLLFLINLLTYLNVTELYFAMFESKNMNFLLWFKYLLLSVLCNNVLFGHFRLKLLFPRCLSARNASFQSQPGRITVASATRKGGKATP